MADQEAPRVPVPGEGPFHHPSPAVARGPAELLAGRLPAPDPFGNAGRDASSFELPPKWLTVIASIRRHSLRTFSGTPPRLGDRHSRQDLRRELELVALGRVQDAGDRYARLLDEDDPLGPLALLGLPDSSAPLLAGAKLPSRSVWLRVSRPRLCRWPSNTRRMRGQTPCSCHRFSRRQQVTGLLYSGGTSFQRAPVRSTQRMPLMVRRSSARGRPRRFSRGSRELISVHCRSVRSVSRIRTTSCGEPGYQKSLRLVEHYETTSTQIFKRLHRWLSRALIGVISL